MSRDTVWSHRRRRYRCVRFIETCFVLTVLSTLFVRGDASSPALSGGGSQVAQERPGRRQVTDRRDCFRLMFKADEMASRGESLAALDLYEELKELGEHPPCSEIIGRAYFGIARCHHDLYQYGKARDAYEKAKEVIEDRRKRVIDWQGDTLIFTLCGLGSVHLQLGNVTEAKKYAQQCISLIEPVNGYAQFLPYNIAFGRALSYYLLGNAGCEEGDYDVALSYLRKALDLFTEISKRYGDNGTQIAEALISIGAVFRAAGDQIEAMAAYTRARRVAQQWGLDSVLNQALFEIGALYYTQGDYLRATQCLDEVLRIARKAGSNSDWAEAAATLGFVKHRQSDYAGALRVFKEAEKLGEGNESAETGIRIQEGLGATYGSLGRYDLSVQSFDRALAEAKRIDNKVRQSEILWWKGDVVFAMGRYEEAAGLAEEACRMSTQAPVANTYRLALTLSGKANMALKNYDQAYQSVVQAIEVIERMRSRAAGQAHQRALFLEGRLEPYHLMIDLLLAQKKDSDALVYAERAKGRVLLDMMHTGRVNISSVMSPEEREQDKNLNNEIISINSRLYEEKLQKEPDKIRIERLNTQLDRARLEYETFKDGIYSVHPELIARRSDEQAFNLEQVKALLPDCDTVLLEFVMTTDKTYLFVISKNCRADSEDRLVLKAIPINTKSADLKELVEQFRSRIANPHFPSQKPARAIYDLLLAPASASLANKRNLVVVPDGVLWDLPFQALRQPNNRYLIEDYALSCAPSLNVLWEMSNKSRSQSTTGGAGASSASGTAAHASPTLLAFGNPLLSSETKERARSIHRDERLLPLPHAEIEVKSVKKFYSGTGATVYTGSEALEQRVKSEVSRYDVLHFATHGVLDSANPMYSHLVMSRAENTDEDGLLEAWEISRLELNADVAVLSACETARGKIGPGEGVIGMSWAFFVAGCPTTVVSQWQVDSASTTALMIEFHKNMLSGPKRMASSERNSMTPVSRTNKAEALRQAMITLLRDKRYRSPYYWAGFVVIGNGR